MLKVVPAKIKVEKLPNLPNHLKKVFSATQSDDSEIPEQWVNICRCRCWKGEERWQFCESSSHFVRETRQNPRSAGKTEEWTKVSRCSGRLQRRQSSPRRRFGMANSWCDGRTIPRCRVRSAHFNGGQSSIHRSTNQNQIWLPHHHG